jgi:hypothetical protein
MVRKFILTLGAIAVVGTAALAPTTASAFFPHKHGHFKHFGIGFYGPGYWGSDDCYLVRRVVITPVGPARAARRGL